MYDQETELYYLQSRYYSPKLCRFISADSYVSTGQGIIGNNMFAYCGNNPISFEDPIGTMMVYHDSAGSGGGYPGIIGSAGRGAIAASREIAQNGNITDKQCTAFSPGKHDPERIWQEFLKVIDEIDSLSDRYPAINLYEGQKDITEGVANINKGLSLLLLPEPLPIEDVIGFWRCLHGVFQIAEGIVKVVTGIDEF